MGTSIYFAKEDEGKVEMVATAKIKEIEDF